ncbi:MAG TPA: hypothetical protein PK468_18685 [Candidatus Hydrogenedentes bacterium]|nr:hypothetical protein [Candidatus Hydrogenedentota bacterium]
MVDTGRILGRVFLGSQGYADGLVAHSDRWHAPAGTAIVAVNLLPSVVATVSPIRPKSERWLAPDATDH